LTLDNSQYEFARLHPVIMTGCIRQKESDFRVDEIPSVQPEGTGEHVWLKVQKTGSNTDWVAGQLAKIAGVKKKDVGYAGLKDRHAVTTQWFSIYLPGKDEPDWQASLPPEIEILESTRHTRKLRTGALQGNRFEIIVRDCKGDEEALNARIDSIQHTGVPNYYGEQRFGHNFSNVEKATAWFSGDFKPKGRHLQGIYLSAARSWIFNKILEQRLLKHEFDQLLDGEVFLLDGSKSWFQEPLTAEITERHRQRDIHPTAALWGKGGSPAKASVAILEEGVCSGNVNIIKGLEANGLKHERRSIRLFADNLSLNWQDETTFQLKFQIPAGSFATAFLREVIDF
jgi:tRNA pseudouridine13 synthase